MTEVTEIEEATLSLNLSPDEGLFLLRLLKSSRDDPRIHGLIGTCFWFHSHGKTEEQAIKDTWTSVEQKLEALQLGSG